MNQFAEIPASREGDMQGNGTRSLAAQSVGAVLNRPISITWGWVLFAAIVLFQWAIFHQFAVREIVWAYPANFDQIYYLGNSYETYDVMINQGLAQGLRHGFTMSSPQGRTLHIQAALLFMLLGASRMTALTLNFIYFVLFQVALITAVRSLSKRWDVAFVALSLLLAADTQNFYAGGLMDFRLDFSNYCLYGIFICLVIRSAAFSSKSWSLVASAIGALLLSVRFLMAPSMAILLSVFFFYLSGLWWLRRVRAQDVTPLRRRMRNLLMSSLFMGVVIAPLIWYSRDDLQRYYLGEVARGANIIRDQENGISSRLESLMFYPRSLLHDHLGLTFMWIAVVVTGTLMLSSLFLRHKKPRSIVFSIDSILLVFILLAFVTPLAFLTIYPTRNAVVANVLVVPAVFFIILGVSSYAKTFGETSIGNRVLIALSCLVICIALTLVFLKATRLAMFHDVRDDTNQVLRAMDEIAIHSKDFGNLQPRIALDRITDSFSAIKVVAYERQGILLAPTFSGVNDIFAPTKGSAISAIQSADFAVINDTPGPVTNGFDYPANIAMKKIQPQLIAAAQASLDPIMHLTTSSGTLTVYMRPFVKITGGSGDWVTSDGIDLHSPSTTLKHRPRIVLRGLNILAQYLKSAIHVKADLIDPASGELMQNVPVEMAMPLAVKPPVPYEITLTTDPEHLPKGDEVRIHLSFDKYVVPKDVGFNSDTRKLVVMLPTDVRLLRTGGVGDTQPNLAASASH